MEPIANTKDATKQELLCQLNQVAQKNLSSGIIDILNKISTTATLKQLSELIAHIEAFNQHSDPVNHANALFSNINTMFFHNALYEHEEKLKEMTDQSAARYLPPQTIQAIDEWVFANSPSVAFNIYNQILLFIKAVATLDTDSDLYDKHITQLYEQIGAITGKDVFKQLLLKQLDTTLSPLPQELWSAIEGLTNILTLKQLHFLIIAINTFITNPNDKALDKIRTLYEQINDIVPDGAFIYQLVKLLQTRIDTINLANFDEDQQAKLDVIIKNIHTTVDNISTGDLQIIHQFIDLITQLKQINNPEPKPESEQELEEEQEEKKKIKKEKQIITELETIIKRFLKQPNQPLVTIKAPPPIQQTFEQQQQNNHRAATPPQPITPKLEPIAQEIAPQTTTQTQDNTKLAITASAATNTRKDIHNLGKLPYKTLDQAQELMVLTGKDHIFQHICNIQNTLKQTFTTTSPQDMLSELKQIELACMRTSMKLRQGVDKQPYNTHLAAYQAAVRAEIKNHLTIEPELIDNIIAFHFSMYSIGIPSYCYHPANNEKKIWRICHNLHTHAEWHNQQPIKLEFADDDTNSKPSTDMHMVLSNGNKKLTMTLPPDSKPSDAIKPDIIKFAAISIEQLGDYDSITWHNIDDQHQAIIEGMCFANWKRAKFNDNSDQTLLSQCMPPTPWDWVGWIIAINKDHPAELDNFFKKIANPAIKDDQKTLVDCLYTLATSATTDQDTINLAFNKGYTLLTTYSNHHAQAADSKDVVIKEFAQRVAPRPSLNK